MKTQFSLPIMAFCWLIFSPLKAQDTQAKNWISKMTLEEKAASVVGTGMRLSDIMAQGPKKPGQAPTPPPAPAPGLGFSSMGGESKVPGAAGILYEDTRLNIPGAVLSDGPAGVRINPVRMSKPGETFYCTAFPIGTLLASTWDTSMVRLVGEAIGNEAKEYGIDIFLGPALNIHRHVLGGRNFEYYSEDPLISGKIAAAYVKGIQSNGVGTSVKHFAANNQESNRMNVNTVVSERALREIYLHGFEIVVKEAKPWTVMSSYNKLNGIYTSENPELLRGILRDEWGFKGFVMSDWFGGRDSLAQMLAGNNLLMPGKPTQLKGIIDLVKTGKLDEKIVDQNLEEILNVLSLSPTYQKYAFSNKPDLVAHASISKNVASEGMILLKNENNTLPITKEKRRIALFGNASYDLIAGGTGSGDVNKAYMVNLSDAFEKGNYLLPANIVSQYKTYIPKAKSAIPPKVSFFDQQPPIAEMEIDKEMIKQSAKENEIAVLTIGRISGEFQDRKIEGDFTLTPAERNLMDNVVNEFHAVGKKVVLILNIGGVIETNSWKNKPDAILLAWQGGQEAGNAILDVITGKINPSGKLTTTFPMNINDQSSAKNFPGEPAAHPEKVIYQEGIYVGYRYFDTYKIKSSYPFGFGLSYTQFAYENLKLSSQKFSGKIQVSVDIANKGQTPGKEIVQLYISAPAKSIDKPEKELRGFAKTKLLQPGEKQTLVFEILPRDLASYDMKSASYIADEGDYFVKIGASSTDIKANAKFELAKNLVVEKLKNRVVAKEEINEYKGR